MVTSGIRITAVFPDKPARAKPIHARHGGSRWPQRQRILALAGEPTMSQSPKQSLSPNHHAHRARQAGSLRPLPRARFAAASASSSTSRARSPTSIVRDGLTALEQPEPPRRLRLREEHRRRRGHPDPDPARLLRPRLRPRGHPPAPSRYGVGLPLRPARRARRRARHGAVRGHRRARRASTSSAGGVCRRTTPRSATRRKAAEPDMFHVFVAPGDNARDDDAFERRLYVIRKRFENRVARSGTSTTRRRSTSRASPAAPSSTRAC